MATLSLKKLSSAHAHLIPWVLNLLTCSYALETGCCTSSLAHAHLKLWVGILLRLLQALEISDTLITLLANLGTNTIRFKQSLTHILPINLHIYYSLYITCLNLVHISYSYLYTAQYSIHIYSICVYTPMPRFLTHIPPYTHKLESH